MDIDQINLNQLRVFDAIMVEGSVSRAAARLRLSQSATSSALIKLRDVLGDPLFIRSTGGMKPTAKAKTIGPALRNALNEMSGALSRVSSFEPATSRRIYTLATTDHVSLNLLPQLLSGLQQDAPHVVLDILSLSPEHGIDPIRLEQLDMLIAPFADRGSANLKGPPNFKIKRLFGERIVALARVGHPLAQDKLTLSNFAAAQHILIAPRGRWLTGSVDRAMAKKGLKRDIQMVTPHYLIAPHVVANSDLMVTLPASIARQAVTTLPVQIHTLPLTVPEFIISMAWHERVHDDPSHRWLRHRLTETCRSWS